MQNEGTPKQYGLFGLIKNALGRNRPSFKEQVIVPAIAPAEGKSNTQEVSAEELAERDRLVNLVTRKTFDAIFTSGFTVMRDYGNEAIGNSAGPDVMVYTNSRVGLRNILGKRYRVELNSGRVVGGLITDHLTLEINDRQDPELTYPDEPIEIRRLVIHRERDKTETVEERKEELRNQGMRDSEIKSRKDEIIDEAEAADNQEMYIDMFKFHRGKEQEPGTFNNFQLPISEQLQFLKGILDASVDPKFTEDIAHVVEERIGKVRWNKPDDSNTAFIKKCLQPPLQ